MAIAIVRSYLRFSVTLHPQNKLQMHYVVVFFVPQYIAYWLCFIWTEFMSFWLVDFLLAALQLLSYFSERMISRETLRRNAVMQRRYGDQVWYPVIFWHITWSVSVSSYPTPIDLITFCLYASTLKTKMYLWIIYSVYYSLNMMIYWLTRWVMCFHLVTRKLIKSLPLHLIYNRIYHDDTSLTEEWFILE